MAGADDFRRPCGSVAHVAEALWKKMLHVWWASGDEVAMVPVTEVNDVRMLNMGRHIMSRGVCVGVFSAN